MMHSFVVCATMLLALLNVMTLPVQALRPGNEVIIGGLGIRGEADLFTRWSATFETYLTETVGQDFNVTFRMIYLDFNTTYTAVENEEIDMIFTNPAVYACVEREYQASPIASLLNLRKGFELDRFYGTFFVRNDSSITRISEIKDKIVEAVSISGLGACQLQWDELILRGHDFLNDPKQVIFANNQKKIVKDVIKGVADIGMVRTDMIEGMAAGNEINISDVRFLEDESQNIHPGFPFPFTTTTAAPEWPLGSLPWMDRVMAKAVGEALYALNSTHYAAQAAKYSTWVTPLSYFGLHQMQDRLGWIDGQGKCMRSSKLYSAIVCPAGHIKKDEETVATACQDAGLSCPISTDDKPYECLCRPCLKVPEQEVETLAVQRISDQDGVHDVRGPRCEKMKFCAQTQQADLIEFEIVDSWFDVRNALGHPYIERMEYIWHGTGDSEWVSSLVTQTSEGNARRFGFNVTATNTGSELLEIRKCHIDADTSEMVCNQVPESPVLLEVVEKVCLKEHQEPDELGICLCKSGYKLSGNSECVKDDKEWHEEYLVPLVVGCIAVVLILVVILVFFYMRPDQKQSWLLPRAEIVYSDPPEVLGRGTFGLVVVATLRNTEVAVKRVLPPSKSKMEAADTVAQGAGQHSMASGMKESHVVDVLEPATNGTPKGPYTPSKESLAMWTATDYANGSPSNAAKDVKANITDDSAETGDILFAGKRNSAVRKESNTDIETISAGPDTLPGASPLAPTIVNPPQVANIELDPTENRRSSASTARESARPSLAASFRDSLRESTNSFRNSSSPKKPSSRKIISTSKKNLVQRVDGKEQQEEEMKANDLQLIQTSGTATAGGLKSTFWEKYFMFQSDEVTKMKKLYGDFVKEMQTMVFLRHPNIVTVMGAVVDGKGDPLLIMERMKNGSLYDLIHNTTMMFDGDIVMRLLNDIIAGMIFLHSSEPPILHNDLKSGNVLVDETFHSKISDFGLSAKRKSSGLLGTPFWMAPELLAGELATTNTDVYAFGVMVYELFTRSEPYSDIKDMSFKEILEAVEENFGEEPFRPTLPEGMPKQVKDLITACWSHDADLRPTFVMIQKVVAGFKTSDVDDWMSSHFNGAQKAGEQKSANQLLYDVFPPHIARTLKAGQKVEPQHHPVVTIFFSDIVGFTDISRNLQPIEVMAMLDRLYFKFDALAREHDIFKVETIGDAYMAVANLIKDQPQHTRNIAEFSIQAIRTANETQIHLERPELGGVNIRVGFHSGPVVSSVVGNMNPRFCLFGDTVNTSSRMESNSIKNCIHMSEAAAMLLRKHAPEMKLVPRGPLQVKGKGTMNTFWLPVPGSSNVELPKNF